LSTTKDKILDAAERLFADHGFSETSLRMITAKADVNLASVNYHFGSKKTLIQAVFERFMEKFTADLSNEMNQIASAKALTVLDVLSTLIKPISKLEELRPHGAGVFMNLLGRAYAETQGHIRRFALERYSDVLNQFTFLLHQTSPHLHKQEMFWRLHFMLGSFIFTLAGHKALQEISESDFQQKISIEEIISQLVPFMSAAFSYDSSNNSFIQQDQSEDLGMTRSAGDVSS
jgi:AcrR family transcriptional regulator